MKNTLPPNPASHPQEDGSEASPCFRPYSVPEIIFETELETKAGSPLGGPQPGDPLELFEQD